MEEKYNPCKDWETMSFEDLKKLAINRDIPNASTISDRKTLINLCTLNGRNFIIYENLPDSVLLSLLRQRQKKLLADFTRKRAIFCLLDDDENSKFKNFESRKIPNPWDLSFNEIGQELVNMNYDFSPFLIDYQDCCYILYSCYDRRQTIDNS